MYINVHFYTIYYFLIIHYNNYTLLKAHLGSNAGKKYKVTQYQTN